MLWNEFIEKIKLFKKEAGKTGLNAPAIIRLIYSGAFDEMLTEEMWQQRAHERYAKMCAEAIQAMGSKAKLPKKGKKESIGIDKVSGVGQLMLWRFSTNPFANYDITEFFKGFIRNQGFEHPQLPEGDIRWIRPERSRQKMRVDIRYSWSDLFNNPIVLNSYNGDRLLGVVGIIVQSKKMIYQGDKESLALTIFNGHEYIEGIRMWPDKSGKLNPLVVATMTELSMGLAIIRPKPWNDRPSGSVLSWEPVLNAK